MSVVEDGVVDDDPVDGLISVGGDDGFFDLILANFAECVLKATVENPISVLASWGMRSSWSSQVRIGWQTDPHFSLHVFSVHSAYSRAEGSAFARIPRR